MGIKTFAAIDVGSFELTMKIFEFTGKNSMKEIDCVQRRLDLGTDTYFNGKISNEKIDELCRTMSEFSDKMRAYKVDGYKAYGTSAIRETENSTIVQDQIAQRTGIKVEVLSNSEQRFLGYKAVAARGETFRRIIEDKTAILDIGGGSIQISLFDKDTLMSTQNLRVGVLRIQEYLNRFEVVGPRAENLIEEMAMAQLSTYKKLHLKDREINNLIVVDDYISPCVVRKSGSSAMLKPADYAAFQTQIRSGSTTLAAHSLGISEEKVPLVFISAMLVERIAEMMGARNIWAPGATLCDGIAYEYAEKNKLLQGVHDFEKDIVACAMNISKRYMGSKKRSETLERITTTIFDSMKKVHGLGKRERLYLRLASILHDCGKYIGMVNIGENSYQIIMATEIIGLSHLEREIVANVARFNYSRFIYYGQQAGATRLDKDSYLIIAKLTAILRLAGGLDRSHKQKLTGLKASLKDNRLVLTVDTQADITLEKGFFQLREEFFKEVFSIEPVLKQHKNL